MKITTRSEWGARFADGSGPAPLPATELFLHHTAGPGRGQKSVRALEAVGQQRFGAGMSYTFLVDDLGAVFEGHSVGRKGTHTGGHNTKGRAICAIGNFESERPNPKMLDTIATLAAYGVDEGWWTRDAALAITPHRDVKSTACPGRHLVAALPAIRRRIAALLATTDPVPTPEPPDQEDDMPEICRSIESNTLWAVNAVGRRALEGKDQTTALDVAAFYVGMGWAKWGPDGKPRDVKKAYLEGVPRTDA